jgi:hypothetical protein
MAGRGVLVNNTLIHHFVNRRNGRTQQFTAGRLIVGRKCSPQFLDLRAQAAAITAVYHVSFDILSSSLYSGFMICHYNKGPLNTGETMSLRFGVSVVKRPVAMSVPLRDK